VGLNSVSVRRIYDDPLPTDGARVLVDRLWPRGVSKAAAKLDEWDKTIAPSTALREWYSHVPERFDEFASRYRIELQEPERVVQLEALRRMAQSGPLTLLTAAKRYDISEATVIAQVLRGVPAGSPTA
jgi:uncharacterized protein YeaO (DUF488 family)